MPLLPAQLNRVQVPPLKCQGIKTKLVPFIANQVRWNPASNSRWIEPFLGSGVVAFNLSPDRALLTDTNQHIIRFYQAVQQGSINRESIRTFLITEGEKLQRIGAEYYYEVRQRFNQTNDPLDFLFLNRSCFNGLIRFNSSGYFNVPFCHKPKRFSPSYITKIANQVDWVAQRMVGKEWEFKVSDWNDTLVMAKSNDFVYLDPPYIGRHTDYYNAWTQVDAEHLATGVKTLPCGFAVSMWLENRHRKNGHVQDCWTGMEVRICQHFYHVGSKEAWRGAIAEALLIKPGFATPLAKELSFSPVWDDEATANLLP